MYKFLIFCLTLSSLVLNAQQVKTKTIKGVILNKKKPLYDVSVMLDGTKFFAISDKKGKFKIQVPQYLWDEEIYIIFKSKGYEDNLVQFSASKQFKKKLVVQMIDSFDKAVEDYKNPDEDVMEYNNIIQSKDVSDESKMPKFDD